MVILNWNSLKYKNMPKILSRFIYLIKLILLFFCIINSCYVVYRSIYPTLPSQRVYKKDLKNIKFPLSFRICLNELINSSDRFKGRVHLNCANAFTLDERNVQNVNIIVSYPKIWRNWAISMPMYILHSFMLIHKKNFLNLWIQRFEILKT